MRRTKIITITAGTPIQVTADDSLASSVTVQAKVSTSGGIVYLILGVKTGDTPSSANGLELPASPTAPSAPFTYIVPDRFSGERWNMKETYIDGAHSGDKVIVTWWEIPQ